VDYELRVNREGIRDSQEVVQRDTLKVYDIKAPTSILELGLRHEEQISLLERVQNSVLAAQSKLIDTGYKHCPKCSQKLHKRGFAQSKFHAVFTDHKVGIQNTSARVWLAKYTHDFCLRHLYPSGFSKIAMLSRAKYSFRQAQSNLDKLTVHRRPVNNHTNVKLLSNQVGAVLAQENLKPETVVKADSSAEEVVIQIDGGISPIKDKDKRSFEALSAIAYRPENIRTVDKHREIEDKSCPLSQG